MTKKNYSRVMASLRNTSGKDSHNVTFVAPFILDVGDIENIFNSLCDVEIPNIWQGVGGYNYPFTDNVLVTVSCKGSYEWGGIPYTTEKMYFKYVKHGMANKESFLPYFKQLYGSTFRFVAFSSNAM